MRKRLVSIVLLFAMSVSLLAGLSLPTKAAAISDEQIIEAALVYLNIKEGNCDSINKNDNGAVSIGMIQWHASRALKLLERILIRYLQTHTEAEAIAILQEKLYNEIKNASTSGAEWNNRIVTAEEAALLKVFLGTPESKEIQGIQAREDLRGYLTRGKVRGMVTSAMQFYYMDMENQYGAGGAYNLITHAKEKTGLDSFVCLGELHNGLRDTTYWERRKSTYNYVTNTLKWEDPYFVSFYGNGAAGTPARGTPVASGESFTIAQNTFTNKGYAFAGWNVRRESDSAWYVTNVGWCSESQITAQNYKKCLYSANQTQTLDSKFLSGAGSYNAFTFVAVWAANGVQLEFYNNYSSGNYVLGSDLAKRVNTDYIAAAAATYTLALDTADTVRGENSLKVTAKSAGSATNAVGFLTSLHGTQANGYFEESKSMTLSFWAKSATSGQKLNLCFGGQSAAKTVTLANEWKQYTVSMDKNKDYSESLLLYPTLAGSFSLSRIQLEDGGAATSFRAETGGRYTSQAAAFGEAYGTLPTPSRSGYSFNGWYTAAVGGTKIVGTALVEKGTRRLYAQWTKHWNCASYGHEWEWQSDVAATCTADGYAVYKCIDCAQTKQESKSLPLGHSYAAAVVKTKATCMTAGEATRTCSRCGMVESQVLAPTGHTASAATTQTAATCEDPGREVTRCTACSTELSVKILPALGHSYGEWVSFTPVTVSGDGVKYHTCTRCGDRVYQIDPYDGHTHKLIETKEEPTCTTEGYMSKACNCGYEEKSEFVAPLGHLWSAVVIVQKATGTRDGIQTQTCSRCGEVIMTSIPATGEQTLKAFNDLPAKDNWAYEGIAYAVKNGLFSGVSAKQFSPSGSMTRAMLVTVLYRLAGEPAIGSARNPFKDVPADTYFTNGVIWAASKGIVTGVSDTQFSPNSNVTREQLATILYRYALYKDYDFAKRAANIKVFPDYAKISAYALGAVSWANAQEIIKGTNVQGTEYLNPKGNATRAQVAVMLMRFVQNVIK